MAIAHLPLYRFNNSAYFCSPLFQKRRLFSSSAALIHRSWTQFTGDPKESDGESAVYKRALKLQRPSTVRFQEILLNSVSLTGVINRPFKSYNAASGRFGVHTHLKVDSSFGAYGFFWVMLKFWDQMAEIAVQHLKLNDLIYVSGPLTSYQNMNEHGKSVYYYQVSVAEVNFIAQYAPDPALYNTVKLEQNVEDIMQRRRNRLHLWHIFFASPDEWWDNRSSKPNPKYPDFKHKDTGETLWLSGNDPPWVKKQLLLYDSRFGKRSTGKHVNGWSFLSPLVCDDTLGT